MIFERDWTKFVGAPAIGYLAFKLMNYLGVNQGFLPTVVVVVVVLGFFAEKFGKAAVVTRKIFTIIGVLIFLTSWLPTAPTANTLLNRAEQKAPRDNFDPKSTGKAEPLGKFSRGFDGKLKPVPLSWNFDNVTGQETLESTDALVREYENQILREESQKSEESNLLSGLCSMVWEGDGEAVSLRGRRDPYDPRRLELSAKGRKYIVRWDDSTTGTWQDVRGTTSGKIFDLVLNEKTNILRGKSSENGMSHRGKASFVLECPTDEPAYVLGSTSKPTPKEEARAEASEDTSLPKRVPKSSDKQAWKQL